MAIDGHRSTFPAQIDTFIEYVDLSPSEKAAAARWQVLKLKESLSSAEMEEFNTLTTQLSNKIFTPESLNKMQDIMYQLETFFKNSVEGYIEQKQTEFNATINEFTYKGIWSSTTNYNRWNVVDYGGEIYFSLQNNNLGNVPAESSLWAKISRKGDQGIPGVGLSFVGEYNNTTSYSVGNAVQYNGSIYYCVLPSTGNLPTNTTYWKLFMSNTGIAVQNYEPSSPYLNMVWIDTST